MRGRGKRHGGGQAQAGPEGRRSRGSAVRIALEWTAVSAAIGWLFYDCWPAGILFLAAEPIYAKERRRGLERKSRRRLAGQFVEALQAMAAAVRAGYSAENAVQEAWRELKILHQEENGMMQELRQMASGLQMNQTLEGLLEDFAEREGLEDAVSFAEVFREGKRSGGNLVQIMEDTVNVIEEKEAVSREVEVLLAGRRYEQRVMAAVPAGMLLYLRLGSPGYLDSLYHSLAGICVMTLALALYAAGICWGGRILEAEEI